MSLLEKDAFEEYMGRLENKIMARFDRYDCLLRLVTEKEPKMLEGEHLLDNQDLCQLLKVTQRTLQRYRSEKQLPYHLMNNKSYYKESDVQYFIKTHFESFENKKKIVKQ